MSSRYQGSYATWPKGRTRRVAEHMRILRRQAAEDRNARTPHERRHGAGRRPCTCPPPPAPVVVEIVSPGAAQPPAPAAQVKKKRWAWRGRGAGNN